MDTTTTDRHEIAETFAVAVEETTPDYYQPQPYPTLPDMEEEEFPYLLPTTERANTRMCISLRASHMAQTKIFVSSVRMPDGDIEHVLGYSNKASTTGANAMVLPIPALELPEKSNFYDMRGEGTTFFEAYFEKHKPRYRSVSKNRRDMSFGKGYDIVETGSYTVIVADSANNIQRALRGGSIPSHKIPKEFPREIISGMESYYKGWPILVCLFEGDINAEPILVRYKPMRPDFRFIPMMDSHDGKSFTPGAPVNRDHSILVGIQNGIPDEDTPKPLRGLFPQAAAYLSMLGKRDNLDLAGTADGQVSSVTPNLFSLKP